ncbi:MAG: PD-(D/E)XK nuclease family protein [Ignavibacteriales bacterium]|nr:PD-(D/E)XK nuclease family protein [Ignavibacteriales bacterium]
MFEFYVKQRERGLPPLSQSSDEQFNQTLEELMNIAANKFDQMQVSDVFWGVEKESLIGSKNRKGILKEFLEIERQNQSCVQPSLFEAAFGARTGSKRKSDPSLSFDKPIRAGNVFLRGKIDRIDMGENLFSIIDDKTGFVPGRCEIDLGISLQLPLYLYAVEHILAEHVGEGQKGVAGIYYELKTPVKERVGLASAEHEGETFSLKRKTNQIVETDEELSRVINQAIKFINDYVDKIVNGFFPVEPKTPEKTCLYCDYLTICRIQLNPSAQSIVEGGAESEEK